MSDFKITSIEQVPVGAGLPCDLSHGEPPPCELTDTTENITFPHTMYAGGNNNSEYVQAEFLPLTPNGFHSPCKREWVRKIRSSTRNS